MEKGFKQGDSLSPLLFIFMDEVITTCKVISGDGGMHNLRSVFCQALAYVEDLLLLLLLLLQIQNRSFNKDRMGGNFKGKGDDSEL